jgi:hypothetical protein
MNLEQGCPAAGCGPKLRPEPRAQCIACAQIVEIAQATWRDGGCGGSLGGAEWHCLMMIPATALALPARFVVTDAFLS